MDKNNFLSDAILDDSEMLEIHGGTSDNITCGSNCGHNCGNNCGNDCKRLRIYTLHNSKKAVTAFF